MLLAEAPLPSPRWRARHGPREGFMPNTPQHDAGVRIKPPPWRCAAVRCGPTAAPNAGGAAGRTLQIPRIVRCAEQHRVLLCRRGRALACWPCRRSRGPPCDKQRPARYPGPSPCSERGANRRLSALLSYRRRCLSTDTAVRSGSCADTNLDHDEGWSSRLRTTALSCGLTASRRSIAASRSSAGVTSLLRTSSTSQAGQLWYFAVFLETRHALSDAFNGRRRVLGSVHGQHTIPLGPPLP